MGRPIFSLPSLALLSVTGLLAPICLASPAVVANPSACPVELSASQRADGVLLAAGSKAPVPHEGAKAQQSIDLSMKNSRLQRIIAAELEVHGTAPGARVIPARAASLTLDEPNADTVRSVHLASSVPADQMRTRNVAVDGLTSVAWISVIELRYADGSVWHVGPGRQCRVLPDGMMLVANR